MLRHGNPFFRRFSTTLTRRTRNAQKDGTAPKGGTSTANISRAAGITMLVLAPILVVYDISYNSQGMLAKSNLGTMYQGSVLHEFLKTMYSKTVAVKLAVSLPAREKLLPDWPDDPFYANVAVPGSPPPPLLVLDLEKTLIAHEYDPKYGWTYTKRPGLDEFITTMSKYYEIAIFSDNELNPDIMSALPEVAIHYFAVHDQEQKDGKILKRLDYLNRDLSRVILIDDNPEAFSLFPENSIQIKPFEVDSKHDESLINLVPLLTAIVADSSNIKDFRVTIKDLGTNNAEGMVEEYNMRIYKFKAQEYHEKNRGLGGMIRNDILKVNKPYRSDTEVSAMNKIIKAENDEKDSMDNKPGIHVDSIGYTKRSSSAQKKKGLVLEYLEAHDKETKDYMMRKNEIMQQIHLKKLAKAEQEELEKKRSL